MSTPAYDALNADLTNESNRKSSYSLLYMGVNIGFSIGPIIGGFLYKDYLPLIFIGDALTTVAALLLIVLYIKEPNRQKEVAVDYEEEQDLKVSTLSVILKRPILILFPLMMLLYQFAYSQWVFTLPIQLGELFQENGARLYGFLGGFNGVIVITFTPILTYLTKKFRTLMDLVLSYMLLQITKCCFSLQHWL